MSAINGRHVHRVARAFKTAVAHSSQHVQRLQCTKVLLKNEPLKKIPQSSDTGTSNSLRIKTLEIKKNPPSNCDSWFNNSLARWFSRKSLRLGLLIFSMLQNAEKEELGQILFDIPHEFDESKYEQEKVRKTSQQYASVLLQQNQQQLPLDELDTEKGLQDCTIVLDEKRELTNDTGDDKNGSDEVSHEIQMTSEMVNTFGMDTISETGSDLMTYCDDEVDDADKHEVQMTSKMVNTFGMDTISETGGDMLTSTDDDKNGSDEVSHDIQMTSEMVNTFGMDTISEIESDLLTYYDDEVDDADKHEVQMTSKMVNTFGMDTISETGSDMLTSTDDDKNGSEEVSHEIQMTSEMVNTFGMDTISETGSDLLTYCDDEVDDADKDNNSVVAETSDNVNSVVPSVCTVPQETERAQEETDTWHSGYQCSLAEYLLQSNPCMQERLQLFSQLLEHLDYMIKHNIAHRDLNIDSMFIYGFTDGVPQLVIEDFGSCLVDHEHGLKIPCNNEYIDKGGTSDLVAPERPTAPLLADVFHAFLGLDVA